MPETVKVPGVGATKKTWVYGGVALLVGIVGYAYWQRSKQQPVEPINPDAIPQDRVPFTDSQIASGGSADTTAGLPLTVPDWVQQATNRLVELGRDPVLIASALGKFITRQPLTPPEEDIVRTAIGQFGNPPGGDIYPILSATPEPPSSTTTTTTTTPSTSNHRYVVQLHRITVNTPVRDLVRRFSSSNPAVATGNNIETAVRRTQADPRNIGDIRTGVALKQHGIYVTTVQSA